MPRVSRFGGANKSRVESSICHAYSTQALPSANDLPSTEAPPSPLVTIQTQPCGRQSSKYRFSSFGGGSKSGGKSSSSHACSTQALPSTNDSSSTKDPREAPLTTQTRRCSRQSSKYWTVDVIDAEGVTRTAHLKLKDLWELPKGTQVVLPLNEYNQPVGEAAGLLGQALGQLGFDFSSFPIGYISWSKVPSSYKEKVYNDKLKEKFILDDDLVKKIILKKIGEKWKDNRSELFHRCYNPKISKEQNLANPPLGIDHDQWTQFIQYRLHPITLKRCKQNAETREKQLVVHTNGSKTLARKRHEMEVETKQPVSRGMLYVATHTKVDGSYLNDAAKTICEKILHVESQGSCSHVIAPNDSLGQVLGKEHSGRVRGMGLGPCPTEVFGPKKLKSAAKSAAHTQMQQEILDLRARLERETQRRRDLENAVTQVLPELAAILNPMAANANGSATPSNASSYANRENEYSPSE